MKHIIPVLALASLATAASAQVAPKAGSKSKYSYERAALGYSSSQDNIDTLTLTVSAEFGAGGVVGASYGDISSDLFDAKSATIFLGYAADIPSAGSLLVGVGYTQLTDLSLFAADGISISAAYRHAIGSQLELNLGILHQEVDSTFGSSDDTAFNLGLRLNATPNLNLTIGYTFADDNFWSIAAGYDF